MRAMRHWSLKDQVCRLNHPFVATTLITGSLATGDPSTGYIALWNGIGTRCSAVGVGQRGLRGRSFIG